MGDNQKVLKWIQNLICKSLEILNDTFNKFININENRNKLDKYLNNVQGEGTSLYFAQGNITFIALL